MGFESAVVTDDSLNKCIGDIRKAIGDHHKKTLETIPRQGYLLHTERHEEFIGSHDEVIDFDQTSSVKFSKPVLLMLTCFSFILLLVYATYRGNITGEEIADSNDSRVSSSSGEKVSVGIKLGEFQNQLFADTVVKQVITSLSRYSNIKPVISDSSEEYRIELSVIQDDEFPDSLGVHVFETSSDELILAEVVEVNDGINVTADHIAALVGSPGGGAIGRHLLNSSSGISVDDLTRPQCLAHGFGCTTCSGEFDTITPRAVQCVANLLKRDSDDADAWALQSTIYARQYFWGSALNEPQKSNQSKRRHFKKLAIEAATRAEGLSDGNNPSVYWGMAQAYLASCDADKLYESVTRGININPSDPSLLGALGNFAAYSGKWNEGVELVRRAIDIDSKYAKKWWYFALAKDYYRRGEYSDAYRYFIKGYDERNWLSPLQLAYTLPYLGRVEEAKEALNDFMRLAPGQTLEHVSEFYENYCFDEEFVSKIRTALSMAGLASRPGEVSSGRASPVGAVVIGLNDREFEYIDVGSGTPIVFVHGSFSDYRTWNYMLIPVSEKHRFISYTQRYFGTQPWPTDTVSYDLHADEKELANFIEYLDVGPVVLVGWSRGVQPAVMVARSRPDLVSSLVLYEGTVTELDTDHQASLSKDAELAEQEREMMDAVGRGDFRTAVKPLFEIALQYPPNTFELQPTALQKVVLDNSRSLIQLFSDESADQPNFNCEYYASVNTPAMVIHGENTNPLWRYESETMADCLPNGELRVLKDASHDGPLSRPWQLSGLISNYLKSLN